MNNVEGHENYAYTNLLERIENIMNQATKDQDEDEEEKDQKGEDPRTRQLSSTKTTWVNFNAICT